MRVTLMMLVRLVAYLGLALSVLAVGLGRLAPPEAAGRRPGRLPVAFVNGFACGEMTALTRFVDADSGQLGRIVLPDGDRLDQASCAPWRDQGGRSQVVGRWSSLSREGADLFNTGTGLGRFTFPEGRPLDRVVTELFPTGPPCWAPGTAASVVFAAGDGRLYRYDFEDDRPLADRRPVPLAWLTGSRGEGPHYVSDPSWPAVPGLLADGLLASVSRREESGGKARFQAPEVWWLRLSPQRDSILSAAPLTPSPPGAPRRFPLAVKGPDGRLVLVSLVKRGNAGWSLAAARLERDPRSHEPCAVGPDETILAQGVCPTPPAVSADGCWVTVMVKVGGEARPRRIRITLGADPEPGPVKAPTPLARRAAGNDHRPPPAGRASEPWG